jgi:uncharacterized SAM-binding protein YcdF (DUF218 family)
LLILLAGWLFLTFTKRKNLAKISIYAGFVLAWLLSCQSVAVLLNQSLLQHYPSVTLHMIQDSRIQAVVILGSGMQTHAPEYQQTAQLSSSSSTRLRYGSILALQSNLPLAFSGGVGWASHDKATHTEAEAAENYLSAFKLPPAKWLDSRSADTEGNAREMALILSAQGIKRIALVTHDWHMERAKYLFDAQGFDVLPAPVNPISNESYGMLNWLPSADGLRDCRHILREVLGLLVLKLKFK